MADGSGTAVIVTISLLGEGSTKSPSLKKLTFTGPIPRVKVQPLFAPSRHPNRLPGSLTNPKPINSGGGSERKRISPQPFGLVQGLPVRKLPTGLTPDIWSLMQPPVYSLA